MIIRKILIENWKSIRRFEETLHDGVNILKGPNEAGKSTVVQAIHWGLYRDVIGTRIKDEVDLIVPASDPSARPTITLQLEFCDCSATVTKTLAPESTQRDCRLLIQRPGGADIRLEREEAQNKLKALHAADGLDSKAQHPLEAAVLISHQGKADDYIQMELSTAVRSTLTVCDDGSIAPTSRLERVRSEVRKRRYEDELKKDLEALAVDAARKNTAAAQLREQLKTLREQREEFARIDAAIQQLRDAIAGLLQNLHETEPRAAVAAENWKDSRERHAAQQRADQEVARHRLEYQEAEAARLGLQKTVDDIKTLRADAERLELELDKARAAQEDVVTAQSEAQKQRDVADGQRQDAQEQWEAARRQAEAWEHCRAVCDAKRELKIARTNLEKLETLQNAAAQAEDEARALPAWPAAEQLREWQHQFHNLLRQREKAAQQLQVNLTLERPLTVRWHADDAEIQEENMAAGEQAAFCGVLSVTLIVPGVGEIRASCASQELHKLVQDIEQREATLQAVLNAYNLDLTQLPDAFQWLEECRAQGEDATTNVRTAQAELQRAVAAIGSIEQAHQQVEEHEANLQSARAVCEPLRHLLPPDVSEKIVALRLPEIQQQGRALESTAVAAQRAWESVMQSLSEHAAQRAAVDAKVENLLTAQRATVQRLAALMEQETSADAKKMDDLAKAAWQAELQLQEAQTQRGQLGDEIAAESVMQIERDKDALLEKLQSLKSELQERRSDLRHQCEHDPKTEIERLDLEIEDAESDLSRHEARLRGIALLEAALEAERHRLGRALAQPLNAQLAPWLSELRGKETHIEFDDNGQRITKVRTKEISPQGEITISLDFDAHSGGMREQTALVMRLILAQLAASRLPGKRLPVILDDPLTQTDTKRRAGLFRVLSEAARSLQIIFVTCHEGHCEGLENANQIRLGELPEPVANGIVENPPAAAEPVKRARSTIRAGKEAATNGHAKVEADTLSLW